jgi:hypothetical protein
MLTSIRSSFGDAAMTILSDPAADHAVRINASMHFDAL